MSPLVSTPSMSINASRTLLARASRSLGLNATFLLGQLGGGVLERAQRLRAGGRELQAQRAPAVGEQRGEVPSRLRAAERAEGEVLARDVLVGPVGLGQHDEKAAGRAALV